MRRPTRSTLRHPVAVLAAGWALMLVAWAMANPPFAAPDEPAHYLRAIAVGEGSFGATPVVETPPGLWARWPTPLGPSCNAGRRALSADCIDDYRVLRTSARIPTEAGGYPPIAYVVPGLALRLADDPASATRAARLAGAAVTLAFLVLAALLLFTATAPLLSLLGLVVAVTPLAIFVGASVSNSGVEIGAGIAFAAALLRLTRSADRPRWVWAAALVSAGALVSSRTTGVLWIALDLVLGAALLWAARTPAGSRDVRRPVALLAGVALAGVVANRVWEGAYGWTLTQRGAVDYSGVGAELGNGVQQIRRLLDEQIGVFGWLDAPMPHAAYPAGQALLVALITLAALVATRRERLVLAATIAAYVSVGVLLSASLVAATGTDVQGRHVLAFSAVVPLLAGELLMRHRGRLRDTSPWLIAAVLVVGTAVLHVVGFAANAYREAVGTDGPLDFALTGAGWAPPAGWWLWSLLLVAGASLVAATAFVGAGEERRPTAAGSTVAFRCNVCGAENAARRDRLLREAPSCVRCGSTVRFRAIADLVAREVLGVEATLPEVPERPDVVGVGLSDWDGYAEPLARKLSYTNTFFHEEPHLDIADPPEHLAGTCDFVIASEVLEHVPPPVQRSFVGLRRLLKPGGLAIVTVPWRTDGETEEHFPRLHRWELVGADGKRVLRNVTADGQRETFDDLVFHGGDGMTLEMRLFSLDGLLRELREAGFEDIRVRAEERRDFGIVWTEPWSLPVTARAPRTGATA